MSKTEKSRNSHRSMLFRKIKVNMELRAVSSGDSLGAKDEGDSYFFNYSFYIFIPFHFFKILIQRYAY